MDAACSVPPFQLKEGVMMLPNSPPHFEDPPPPPDTLPSPFVKAPRRRRCLSSSSLFRNVSGVAGSASVPVSPLASPPRPLSHASRGREALRAPSGVAIALSQTLAELSLSPPPGKIRRRNALTQNELFVQSREMQSLQDKYRLHFLRGRRSDPIWDGRLLQKEFDSLSLDGESRRKKATQRSQEPAGPTTNATTPASQSSNSAVPTSPSPVPHSGQSSSQSSRRRWISRHVQGERMYISLHKDIRGFRPTGQVPASLADRYTPAQHPIMLYQSPSIRLQSILPPSAQTPKPTQSDPPPSPDSTNPASPLCDMELAP